MPPRQWNMTRALESVRQLVAQLPELTDEEVLACLQLEFDTRRRKSVIDRLVVTAADRHRQTFILNLQEQYKHGPSEVRHPHPR